MDRFQQYVRQLFAWNEEMKRFLNSKEVAENSELWRNLEQFTGLIESISQPLTDQELLDLQANAENIHEEMENYFKRKQVAGVIRTVASEVPPGGHVLPALPYAYNALEPVISGEIMKLHHDLHHRAYVAGLNKAELELKKARETGSYSLVKHWSRELAFHGSGHYLHTIFWQNMGPASSRTPKGRTLKEVNRHFGNFQNFKAHFSEAAKQVEGNGWAILVWSTRSRHLEILQVENHMHFVQWETIPILVLDVWKHAYYPQYKNNREAYVDNWWGIVNWDHVERRMEKARELKWDPD